jgi:hypothetical protein
MISMRPPTARRRTGLRVVAALVASLAFGAVRAPIARADDFDAALAKYKAWLKRPSLYKRMQGRMALARTGSPRALGIFTDDYLHPEDPKDNVRYLIATAATENITAPGSEVMPLYAAWRSKAREPIDSWLWYRSLCADRVVEGTAALDEAKNAGEPVLFRAAALRALATVSDTEGPAIVTDVLDHLPVTEPGHELLIETCSAVARTWGMYLKDDKFRAVVERIARLLDDEKISLDARDIVARNMAGLFGTDILGPGSGPWLRELKAAQEKAEGAEPPEVQYAPGPFFGLRAIGRRVVFVIDASDSMLMPLTEGEQKKMKTITPSDAPPSTGKPPASAGPRKDPIEPLPWQKIKCRFDAAREVLKISMRALKPDQSFCVIFFGSDAKAIPTTPGLRPADAKTIEAAAADLDRMKADPAPGDKARPYGKLRGDTNLHGGVRLAFRVSTGKLLGPGEYVDRSRTGCDAIYVLSDGVPCVDDFRKDDKRDDEHTVKDRETMTPVADTPTVQFQGPYGDKQFESYDFLTDDIRRMNLFRQVEIHCVAIGEADDTILQTIADIGGGRFRRVGDDLGAPPPPAAPEKK